MGRRRLGWPYSKPIGCKTGDDMSASGTHHPTEFKHAADMEWEMGRFGNVTKFLFPTGTSDGAQCGISQIRAGRVLSAAPARLRADLVHHRGRIHFCRKGLRPWHDGLYARPALRA